MKFCSSVQIVISKQLVNKKANPTSYHDLSIIIRLCNIEFEIKKFLWR